MVEFRSLKEALNTFFSDPLGLEALNKSTTAVADWWNNHEVTINGQTIPTKILVKSAVFTPASLTDEEFKIINDASNESREELVEEPVRRFFERGTQTITEAGIDVVGAAGSGVGSGIIEGFTGDGNGDGFDVQKLVGIGLLAGFALIVVNKLL